MNRGRVLNRRRVLNRERVLNRRRSSRRRRWRRRRGRRRRSRYPDVKANCFDVKFRGASKKSVKKSAEGDR